MTSETSSEMGAVAVERLLYKNNLKLKDVDALISTSGTMEQEIPCTAALIKSHLKEKHISIPCFDINSTCLSFLTGLDVISYMVQAGRYSRVILVATEATSTAINWDEKESASLIGDGAAAILITRTPPGETSAILSSRMETLSEGTDLVEFPGCGTKMMGEENPRLSDPKWKFRMSGNKIFKLAAKKLPPFVDQLLHPLKMTLGDIKLIVPHQASLKGLRLVQRRLDVSDEQFFINIQNRGNMVAASIPVALAEAIQMKKALPGDNVMLLGTSAGFSIGGMILRI